MKKKALSLALALVMCLGLLPATALAAYSYYDQKCGQDLTWSLGNGTITISGTGWMQGYDPYFSPESAMESSSPPLYLPIPWRDRRDTIKTLIIEEGATSIGHCAFWDCKNLTSVTIPSSVTRIVDSAFLGCSSLKDIYYGGTEAQWNAIEIDDSNDALKKATIHYNSSAPTQPSKPTTPTQPSDSADFEIESGVLKKYKGAGGNVTIPDGVTEIDVGAFAGCMGLTGVTIPDSVTDVGPHAFSSCKGLTSVTIPNSVTSIGVGAFSSCTGLTSVTLSSSITSIGSEAFYYCESLTSVTIPGSVTSIERWAFGNCTGLTNVTIPDSVTSIADQAFYGCTGLTSVTIPGSVTSIGSIPYIGPGGVFQGCTGLTSVTISDGVTDIGCSAFAGCTGLTSVTIPDSVTRIRAEAFAGCTGLTNMTIPSSVTDIWGHAFSNTPWLKSKGEFPIVNGILLEYQGTGGSVTIPGNVTSIAAWTFSGCEELTSVTIPDGITSIESCTFLNCTGLTSVTIPNSVTSIGTSAFAGCTGLTSVTIPSSVTSIEFNTFKDCTSLKDVYYDGTEAQWNAIRIDDSNGALKKATIHYNSAGPAQSQQPTEATASPTNDSLLVDGNPAEPTAYKIDGSNYFKLRDVAALLNGTPKQFNVGYDSAAKSATITTGQGYAKTSTDLQGKPTAGGTATISGDKVLINGVESSLTVYKINGSNYFKLRDLGKALDFNVGWSKDKGMYIEGSKSYTDAD